MTTDNTTFETKADTDIDATLRRLHAHLRGLQGDERRAPRPDRAAHVGRRRHDDKLERIDEALDEQKRSVDELDAEGRRARAGGAPAARGASGREHKAAFDELCAPGRGRRSAPIWRSQGAVGRLRPGWRLSRARPRSRPASCARCARSRRSAPSPASARSRATSTRSRSRPPAPAPAGSARRRRGRRPTTPDAGRARLPDHGALRHAGGDADAARRRRRQHRRVDRRRGPRRLRRAGGHGLRHRQRRQQAEGLPRTTPRSPTRSGRWGKIGYRDRRRRRLPGPGAGRQADRSHLLAEGRLSRQRPLGHEPRRRRRRSASSRTPTATISGSRPVRPASRRR